MIFPQLNAAQLGSLFCALCVSVPEQRLHAVLRLQRFGQTDPAEPQEPRGTLGSTSVQFIQQMCAERDWRSEFEFVLFRSVTDVWSYFLRVHNIDLTGSVFTLWPLQDVFSFSLCRQILTCQIEAPLVISKTNIVSCHGNKTEQMQMHRWQPDQTPKIV